jgi:hypothetical protein
VAITDDPLKAAERSPKTPWLSAEVLLLAAFIAGATAIFVALGRAGWPGAPSHCLRDSVCYCEVPALEALARQPWNTWSSLVFSPVALAIAADSAKRRDTEKRRGARGIGVLFAVAVAFEGLGSLFFHGSLTTWGAVLDAAGIAAIASLVFLVTLLRARVLEYRSVLVGWPLLFLVGLCYRAFVPVMAPLALLLTVGVFIGERRARRLAAPTEEVRRWFAGTVALFVVGGIVLGLSALPGFPLCGARLTQGHAVWHLLAALASGGCWRLARAALVMPYA